MNELEQAILDSCAWRGFRDLARDLGFDDRTREGRLAIARAHARAHRALELLDAARTAADRWAGRRGVLVALDVDGNESRTRVLVVRVEIPSGAALIVRPGPTEYLLTQPAAAGKGVYWLCRENGDEMLEFNHLRAAAGPGPAINATP